RPSSASARSRSSNRRSSRGTDMSPLPAHPARTPSAPPRCRLAPVALGALLLAALPGGSPVAAGNAAVEQPDGKSKAMSAESAADVVARVNGRPILRRDFDLAVQIQFRGRRPSNVGLKELQNARAKVLEHLIENELLYQKASKTDGSVPDKDVDHEYQRIKD